MRKVRWAGWTVAAATALLMGQTKSAVAQTAAIESDKPAAIVVYPKITVNSDSGVETTVRLANTNQTNPVLAHCFYLDANSHCSNDPTTICTDNPTVCSGIGGTGLCLPGWQETDFRILLTPGQPIEWLASVGLADSDLPLPTGACSRNPSKTCGSDADCNPFPGGPCTASNAGTRIPPVAEDPYAGELRCIVIDANGNPIARNDLKGEVLITTNSVNDADVASYNALGVQATGNSDGNPNTLTLGGSAGEYAGCPNYLILNHFFDDANDPIPGSNASITTNLVLVPCSADYLRQVPGLAVAQYLVFNEFEQRFSTSKSVRCYQDIQLCNIDTPNCDRSIWNVGTAGTLTGQTRINPIGVASTNPPSVASGLLGVAVETHSGTLTRSAAFNLHMQGAREQADTITIP